MGTRTTVLIADGHPVVLVGLRKLLERDESFEIVGESRSGPELVTLVSRHDPDVVLLDWQLPGLDGIVVLDRIRARCPDAKVVVLASEVDDNALEEALRRGASGYIVKSVQIDDLVAAVRSALQGSVYRPMERPAATDRSVAGAAGLSDRELEILRGVAAGLSNKGIGAALWISEPTVKFHLTNIYGKLGVANRTGAARWAFANGIRDSAEDGTAIDGPFRTRGAEDGSARVTCLA